MLSNATKFRRTAAGPCLMVVPLFLLIRNLIQTPAPISTDISPLSVAYAVPAKVMGEAGENEV